MQDAGIVEIASSPEAYIRYLELQGDNPYYSPGNIALAMFQKSDVTQFGTREKWKSLGRSVKDSEAGKGFQIFSRGTFGKGYVLAPAYDISQTYGREVKKAVLENNSPEMEKALSTVYGCGYICSDSAWHTDVAGDSVRHLRVVAPGIGE